jgi:hypothetical protein
MSRFVNSIFLFCGLILTLAALPVFGQEKTGEIEINRQPLRDFSKIVKEKFDRKEVDLAKSFLIQLDGALTKDGKFDGAKSKFVRTEGDAQTVQIAKQAIEAVGDSGWLGYLRNQGIEKINLTVAQDDSQFSVNLISELPTPERAKTFSTAMTALIQAALLLDKNGSRKLGEDEKLLLSSTKISSENKNFALNIAIPKPTFQEMIQRKLPETEKKEVVSNSK